MESEHFVKAEDGKDFSAEGILEEGVAPLLGLVGHVGEPRGLPLV